MELTVDGHPVEVPEGAHVLDATRTAGTDVPTLCHDDRVSPAGVCRACLVRADGEVVAACVTPAVAGMVVTTTDSEVTSQVSLVLGLMAERLPVRALDRPSELTALCERFGVGSEAFGGGRGLDATATSRIPTSRWTATCASRAGGVCGCATRCRAASH